MSKRSIVSVSHSAASRRHPPVRDVHSRSSDENDLVHLSHPHSSDSRSSSDPFPSSDDWDSLGEDDIDPSDSASRPPPAASRHSSRPSAGRTRSHISERSDLPRRAPSARPSVIEEVHIRSSSRRPDDLDHHHEHQSIGPERVEYHEHHPHREHAVQYRVPFYESQSLASSDSYDEQLADYPPQDHYQRPLAGSPPPPSDHRPSYPPTMSDGHGAYNPFIPPHHPGFHPDSLVRQPRPRDPYDPYERPDYPPFHAPLPPQNGHHPNPFLPRDRSRYAHHNPPQPPREHRPMGPSRHPSYFPNGGYPGQEMVHNSYFNQSPPLHGMPPYGMPPPPQAMMYPPYGYPPYHSPPLPQQPHHSPPIVDPASKEPAKPDTRDEEHRLALAKQEQEHQRTLVKLQSYEDAKRLMEEKALQDERERYAAMVLEKKRLEKEKADWEASIAKTEAERALKEQISAAEKKVKEAADVAAAEKTAKLKAEHDKAIEEAKKKAAELEAAKKTLEEEAKKNAPDPDSAKAPIIFKDALGRKFNFPYGVCKTWKGMHALIRQAFVHVPNLGPRVMEGQYDLTGPSGDIILPQVWDSTIKPEWEISMHMWPEPEPDILAFEDLIIDAGPRRHKSNKGKGKDDKKKVNRVSRVFDEAPMPPPIGRHAGPPPPPLGRNTGVPAGVEIVQEVRERRKPVKANTKTKKVPAAVAFFAGVRTPR